MFDFHHAAHAVVGCWCYSSSRRHPGGRRLVFSSSQNPGSLPRGFLFVVARCCFVVRSNAHVPASTAACFLGSSSRGIIIWVVRVGVTGGGSSCCNLSAATAAAAAAGVVSLSSPAVPASAAPCCDGGALLRRRTTLGAASGRAHYRLDAFALATMDRSIIASFGLLCGGWMMIPLVVQSKQLGAFDSADASKGWWFGCLSRVSLLIIASGWSVIARARYRAWLLEYYYAEDEEEECARPSSPVLLVQPGRSISRSAASRKRGPRRDEASNASYCYATAMHAFREEEEDSVLAHSLAPSPCFLDCGCCC